MPEKFPHPTRPGETPRDVPTRAPQDSLSSSPAAPYPPPDLGGLDGRADRRASALAEEVQAASNSLEAMGLTTADRPGTRDANEITGRSVRLDGLALGPIEAQDSRGPSARPSPGDSGPGASTIQAIESPPFITADFPGTGVLGGRDEGYRGFDPEGELPTSWTPPFEEASVPATPTGAGLPDVAAAASFLDDLAASRLGQGSESGFLDGSDSIPADRLGGLSERPGDTLRGADSEMLVSWFQGSGRSGPVPMADPASPRGRTRFDLGSLPSLQDEDAAPDDRLFDGPSDDLFRRRPSDLIADASPSAEPSEARVPSSGEEARGISSPEFGSGGSLEDSPILKAQLEELRGLRQDIQQRESRPLPAEPRGGRPTLAR